MPYKTGTGGSPCTICMGSGFSDVKNVCIACGGSGYGIPPSRPTSFNNIYQVVGFFLLPALAFIAFAFFSAKEDREIKSLSSHVCQVKQSGLLGRKPLPIEGALVVIWADTTNVRKTPDINGDLLGAVAKYDQLFVTGCDGDCAGFGDSPRTLEDKGLNKNAWIEVCYFEASKKLQGFVRGDLLRVASGSDYMLRTDSKYIRTDAISLNDRTRGF